MLVLAAALMANPADARAEWTVAGYLGASWTSPDSLALDQPANGVHLSWSDVTLRSRSFESPPYYGYRIGWFPSPNAPLGVQGELIHLKVFADSDALAPAVQRFSISHGLNLLLGSVVWRQPQERRVRFAARAGIGVAIPHGESQVFGVSQEQYEVSSLALQGAVGPTVRLATHLGAIVEYKVTTARPAVSVAGGTMTGRYTSQHVAAGLEVWW
jgi:hypothetical protein